jgi:dTDP-4-dehydrorhamnose reductase
MIANAQQRILVTGITSIHGWPIWRALSNVAEASSFGVGVQASACNATKTSYFGMKGFEKGQLFGIRPPQTKAPLADNIAAVCITDTEQLERIRREFRPTSVIHCAGVCDLDLCEERPEWAYDLNVNGMKAVTEVFGDTCKIIYMSTDLVFSGEQSPASGYAEHHSPDPISVAGKTFLQAEQVLGEIEDACIVRLGLPLGDSITGDKGAIDWIKSRLTKDRPVTLFHDELRSCIRCDQIAEMIGPILSLNLQGMYHFGGNRPWTLHEIGQHVLGKYGCSEHLLKGIYRHEETNGPPRIGDVSMDCNKLKAALNDVEIIISDFN